MMETMITDSESGMAILHRYSVHQRMENDASFDLIDMAKKYGVLYLGTAWGDFDQALSPLRYYPTCTPYFSSLGPSCHFAADKTTTKFSKFFAALECDVFDGSPFTYEGVHSKRPSCVSVNSNSSDDDGNKYFVTLSY